MKCPIHGTEMIESADDRACQDVDCKYGHGMKNVQMCFQCYGRDEYCQFCNGDRVVTKSQNHEWMAQNVR